ISRVLYSCYSLSPLSLPSLLLTSLTHITFFSNDTPTSEIYTLSLHDALPILLNIEISTSAIKSNANERFVFNNLLANPYSTIKRSEEHTSELQSRFDLVCRLLLEKKKKIKV